MATSAAARVAPLGRTILYRAWAGLECGVAGGALALAWYALHSVAHAEFWWTKFNIAAVPLYGEAVYRLGVSAATLAGAALLLLIYSLSGALFGVVAGLLPRVPALAAALLCTALLHAVFAASLRPLFGPWAPTWFPTSATLPAHLLLAALLARWPQFHTRLVAEFAPDLGSAGAALPANSPGVRSDGSSEYD
jgi:hypothetical protein